MRNFDVKHVQKVVPETNLKSITCDMCETTKEMEYEHIENMFQHIKFSFGYGSKFDGEHWCFDLCDDCVEKLVKSLKYVPYGMESLETDVRQMSQEEFDRWKTDKLLPYNGIWSDDEDIEGDED